MCGLRDLMSLQLTTFRWSHWLEVTWSALSINASTLWNCEWLRFVYLMVSYYLDNRGNSRAYTCTKSRLFGRDVKKLWCVCTCMHSTFWINSCYIVAPPLNVTWPPNLLCMYFVYKTTKFQRSQRYDHLYEKSTINPGTILNHIDHVII